MAGNDGVASQGCPVKLPSHPRRGRPGRASRQGRRPEGLAGQRPWPLGEAREFEVWWDERTRLLAELVPPGSRVIEFGAGRRQLERYLDQSCTYVPSDLVDRGPGTIVCDLNQRPLPDLSRVRPDVAVFGGVLEYVANTEALIAWLAPAITRCVASYAYVDPNAGLAERVSRYVERWRNGYMSHHTEQELIDLFGRNGFVCNERRTWQAQGLFRFDKARGP